MCVCVCVCSIETSELIKLVFGTEANFCLSYCHIVLHGNSGIDKTGGTSPGSSYIASSELSRFFLGEGVRHGTSIVASVVSLVCPTTDVRLIYHRTFY